MKTHSLYKHLFATVLMLAAVQTVSAQDAFYIYRNDGDFNGFFFDEIVRMGYSKFDLDSVEHDVYVIQEVETTDSLYRIPLAAIDSIGYQQPEIRFNPRLKVMDDLGYEPYFITWSRNGYGERCIWFKGDLPEELVPEVGDVLVCLDPKKLPVDEKVALAYGDSHSGKVREVQRFTYSSGDVNFIVKLDPLSDIGDVFDQFICLEQLGFDNEGHVRRRIAGINPDGTLKNAPQRRLNGNFDLTIVNWNGRLQFDTEFFKNQSENFVISGNIGVDVGVLMKAQFVYRTEGVFKKRFYCKGIFSNNVSAGLSGKLTFEGKKEWAQQVIPIPKILAPTFFPIFETGIDLKAFTRVSGSANFQFAVGPFSFGHDITLTFDTDDDWLVSLKWGNRDKQEKGWTFFNDGSSLGNLFSVGTTLSGYLQMGLKAEIGIGTNSWLKSLAHTATTMDVYVGPKLEGNLNFDWGNTGDGWNDLYRRIKQSDLTLTAISIDREAKAKYSVFNGPVKEHVFYADNTKIGSASWYIFPEFNSTDATVDNQKFKVKATVYPRRQICFPGGVDVGIAIYNKDMTTQEAIVWKPGKAYSFTNNFVEYTDSIDVSNLDEGYHNVVPVIRVLGREMPVKDAAKSIRISPWLKVKYLENNTDSIQSTGGTYEYELDSNTGNIIITSKSEAIEQAEIFIDEKTQARKLRIKVGENKNLRGQTWSVELTAEGANFHNAHCRLYFKQAGTGSFSAFGGTRFWTTKCKETITETRDGKTTTSIVEDVNGIPTYIFRDYEGDSFPYINDEACVFNSSRSGNIVTSDFSYTSKEKEFEMTVKIETVVEVQFNQVFLNQVTFNETLKSIDDEGGTHNATYRVSFYDVGKSTSGNVNAEETRSSIGFSGTVPCKYYEKQYHRSTEGHSTVIKESTTESEVLLYHFNMFYDK